MALRTSFNLSRLTHVNMAVAYFTEHLLGYLIGISHGDHYPAVRAFVEKHKLGYESYGAFKEISLHVVPQVWGSTAVGWGGVGGAAMTSDITTLISANNIPLAAVFWGGKLAYVVEVDQIYYEVVQKYLYRVPSYQDVESKLTLIFKPERKNLMLHIP